ncbi:hypothetical protein M408DRAFT_64444 [Serendipita vermifera MAFF 305830]|uniref:HSF-type DNA-binding domain-containing protein n=1 Tax=Serendipita vermifera MAFF 305830 TaxID=933852 RepID=A0A0C2XRX5_SERVB|nr:hypothetical protein M408DRAFT_64444 [Serendipita vermifera MAFF 305830]
MVDDPATDRFIKWADDGNSFYVFNPDQFAKELLGTYYKTDASASFVRQLNMYGFHKVPHVRQGALKSDKQAQAWHYRNPNFRRGRPDLLPYITRKGKAIGGAGSPKSIDMSQIINGLATIKRHQTLISDNLKELQSSNQALWQEAMEARERHRKHQETINRILKFLASLFQGSATPIRSASLNSGKSSSSDAGPTVVPRPRLMIKDVQDREEDHEDTASTPRSSVRMEEIELLDDDIPPSVFHPYHFFFIN